MTIELAVAAIFVIQVVFFAGVWWTVVRYMRKDLNGIGEKVRQLELKLFYLGLLLATKEQEPKILEILVRKI